MPSDYLKLMGTEWKVRIANVASGNGVGSPEYVGEANPNTATSAVGWRIKKITYDSNGNPTEVNWASGNANRDKIWDSRTTYAYS